MKSETIKKVILIILIVGIFILILVETNKSKKGFQMSEYAEYSSKYKGEPNQIEYIKVDDFGMAQKYLSDFVSVCLMDTKEAYSLIDTYYKSQKFKNYNEFEKELNHLMSKVFLEAKVEGYKIKNSNGYKLYYIKDAADNTFVFKEKGIMNYSVYLDMNTLDL